MDMTNVDRRKAYTVTAGPYKGMSGWKVSAADVRGDSRMVYLEGSSDGLIYEISPKHVKPTK